MQPRFESKPTFTVVGKTCHFTMKNNVIPRLWDEFGKYRGAIPHAIHKAAYGVCFYQSMEDAKDDITFTYLAGFEVSKVDSLPGGMTARTLPACDYAIFEHKGSLDTLQETYTYIFSQWLPSSGYTVVKQDDFELYGDRFKYGEADSVMEIWIPVKKK